MAVIITWHGDTTGLDLHPTWAVDEVRIHTVRGMLQPDGVTRKDTLVLVIMLTLDQMKKLFEDFGRSNIPLGSILPTKVIPLYVNAVLWTWKPPEGYETRLPEANYTAFSLSNKTEGEKS